MTVFAYLPGLDAPFTLDDYRNIVDNPAVHRLWPPWQVIRDPGESLISGRPLTLYTFAVNQAIHGGKVLGYHLTNLGIHILAAFALFGILRRTLLLPRMRSAFGSRALSLAFFCAAAWAVHPLCTQAVTYATQRIESLAGLFFLLTLYLAVRGWEAARFWPWGLLSVLAFAMGTGAKETILGAPFLVFLFDLTFISPGPGAALKNSRWLYLGYFYGLVLLLLLVATGRTAGPGLQEGIGPWDYAVTQPRAVLTYLKLVFWPAGLCFSYGGWQDHLRVVAGTGPPVFWLMTGTAAAGLFATALLVWKRRPAGYLGAWFFGTLALTSSWLPLADPLEEHRAYLAAIAPVCLVILGGYRLAEMAGRRRAALRTAGTVLLCGLVLALTLATRDRNRDYRTELALWRDTVEKCPGNSRARHNLAFALFDAGDLDGAVRQWNVAVGLSPAHFDSWYNLGNAHAAKGDLDRAVKSYGKALSLAPNNPSVLLNLGVALARQGRLAEARQAILESLARSSQNPGARKALEILDAMAKNRENRMDGEAGGDQPPVSSPKPRRQGSVSGGHP